MRTRLISIWQRLRASFWFLPALLTATAFSLSLVTLSLDDGLKREGLTIWGIYKGGPEGARAVLSAVASSMISVTGITFSITIVALTLASSQFGPRLLRNFMRDTGTQIVLGVFLATFVFCLMVLRRVNRVEEQVFVPHVSVSIGVALALGSLALLIYFIHHVAQSIQAESVIATVGADLDDAIERLYPETLGKDLRENAERREQLPPGFARESAPFEARCSGYIHAIEGEGLMQIAVEHDLIVRVNYKPGDYVIAKSSLVHAWPASRLEKGIADKINHVFIVGNHRTGEQDAEFAAHQLVEVALRALSPGINDTFTAINCIDRLGASLAKLAGRVMPSGFRYDKQGKLRVITEIDAFEDIVDAAFNPIRQSARNNAAVTIRLLEMIQEMAPHVRLAAHRSALLRHAETIERGSHAALPEEEDRKDVRARYREAIKALEGEAPVIV